MKHLIKEFYYGNAVDQFIRVHQPMTDLTTPLLVIVHGGYWKHSHTLDTYATSEIVQWVIAENLPVTVANIEYRRMDGPYPDIGADAMISDIRVALNELSVIFDNDAPSMLIGHSAGGYLSAMATSTYRGSVCLQRIPDSMLLVSSILYLEGGLSRIPITAAVSQPEQVAKLTQGKDRRSLSPCRYQPRCSNIDLWHGGSDDTVPITHSLRFKEAWPEFVKSETYERDADHFSSFQMSAWPEWRDRKNYWDDFSNSIIRRLGLV